MIRNPSLIKDIYNSAISEVTALGERQELSSFTTTVHLLSKGLLLSCASYYEWQITEILSTILKGNVTNKVVSAWVKNEVIDRKFYKWFNFKSAKDTNQFFSMFGAEFKENMRGYLSKNERRKKSEQSFLNLCTMRNKCVHNNFGTYSIELTIHEIYLEHLSAMTYIRAIDIGATKWLSKNPTVV